MASMTSDTGDTSSKQQQAQHKENYDKNMCVYVCVHACVHACVRAGVCVGVGARGYVYVCRCMYVGVWVGVFM